MRKQYQQSNLKANKKFKNLILFFTLPGLRNKSDEFRRFSSPKNLKVLRKFTKSAKEADFLPLEKLKKLAFLFLITQRKELFVMNWEICSTYYARELEVSPRTVLNWLKELQLLGWLTCKNRRYRKDVNSKEYKIEKSYRNEKFVEMINDFNGFNKKNPSLKVSKLVKEIRAKKVRTFDFENYRVKDCCRLAQSYLNDPKAYLKLFLKHGSDHFNYAPRVQNPAEINLWSAVRAYNHVMRKNKRKERIDPDLLCDMRIGNPRTFLGQKREMNHYDKRRIEKVLYESKERIKTVLDPESIRNYIETIALMDLFKNGIMEEDGKIFYAKAGIRGDYGAWDSRLMIKQRFVTARLPGTLYERMADQCFTPPSQSGLNFPTLHPSIKYSKEMKKLIKPFRSNFITALNKDLF